MERSVEARNPPSPMETSFEDMLAEAEKSVRKSADERCDVTTPESGKEGGGEEDKESENSEIYNYHQRDILRAEAHIRNHLAEVNRCCPPRTLQLTELRDDRPLTLAKAKIYAERAAAQGYTDVVTASIPKKLRPRIGFPAPLPPPPTDGPADQTSPDWLPGGDEHRLHSPHQPRTLLRRQPTDPQARARGRGEEEKRAGKEIQPRPEHARGRSQILQEKEKAQHPQV